MRTTRFAMVLWAGALLLASAPAYGVVKTFQPASGNWNVIGNWLPPGPPENGDHAVIGAGKTCFVEIANAECDSFDVDGTLIINAGQALKIDQNSTLDGGGLKIAEGAQLNVVVPGVHPVIVSGAGRIEGQGTDGQPFARIVVTPGAVHTAYLKSQVLLTGRLDISVTGAFINEGGVKPNGEIRIGVTHDLGDVPGDLWVLENPSSRLRINVGELEGAPNLVGNFVIRANVDLGSTISIFGALATSGRLEMHSGTLEIEAGQLMMGDDNPQNPKHMDMTGGYIQVAPEAKFTHN